MTVAFGHATIATVPALAMVAVGLPSRLTSVERALSYTPLHVLWAGQEWVIVFFVLSGFVLSLASSAGAPLDARSYYPRRFIRLYVPVWAALALATVAHIAVAHTPVDGATVWLNSHAVPLSASRAARDSTLIFGAGDGSFTTVLWSLQWEVLFSLLLPGYLILASRINLGVLAAGALSIIVIAGARSGYAHYLPAFMLGVVIAYGRSWLRGILTARKARLLLPVSLCLLSGNWWMPSGVGQSLGMMFVAAGASGLVICGLFARQFVRLLQSRPLQLVGSRSFSLYLVHEPLLVAVAFALGGKPTLPVLLLVATPLIVLTTEAFYRLVERPTIRLARTVGRQVLAPSAI